MLKKSLFRDKIFGKIVLICNKIEKDGGLYNKLFKLMIDKISKQS